MNLLPPSPGLYQVVPNGLTDEELSLWSGIAILSAILLGVAAAVTWKFQSLPLICQLTR